MTGELATRVMKARHPSVCPRCGRHINVGHQIAYCGGLWWCIRCVLDHQAQHHTKETSS